MPFLNTQKTFKSKLTLAFSDPQDTIDYNLQKRHEIIFISALLFVQRMIFLIILLVSSFQNDTVDNRRLWLNGSGRAIHLIALLALIFSRRVWVQQLHGPIIILSYLAFVFNKKNAIQDEQFISLFGQHMIIIVCIVIMNTSWIITAIAVVCSFVSMLLFLGVTQQFYMGLILPQMVIFCIILVFISYFCDKKSKEEFLQVKLNMRLNEEMRHIIEVVPEGILIYDPHTKDVLMANTELQRLVNKYEKLPSQIHEFPQTQNFSEEEAKQGGKWWSRIRSLFNCSHGSKIRTRKLTQEQLKQNNTLIKVKESLSNIIKVKPYENRLAAAGFGVDLTHSSQQDTNQIQPPGMSIYEAISTYPDRDQFFSFSLFEQREENIIQSLQTHPQGERLISNGEVDAQMNPIVFESFESLPQENVPNSRRQMAAPTHRIFDNDQIGFADAQERQPNDTSQNFDNIPQNRKKGDVVQFKEVVLNFQDREIHMIVVKNLTQLIRYQETELSNNFFELLTATVSHEMTTPLNSILALLSNVIRNAETEPDQFCAKLSHQLQELKIVRSSCNMLHYLVNDMVDLYQLKNKRFKRSEKTVDINKIVEEIIDIIKIPCQQKGISIDFHMNPTIPSSLILDSKRFKQILMNLLQNAVKFTYHGSIMVKIAFERQNKFLTVEVTDTGIGISEADQKNLFQVFGKLKNTQSTNTSGIGLGLYICRQLCKALRGDIVLKSSEERVGTCFQFKVKTELIEESQMNERELLRDSIRHQSSSSSMRLQSGAQLLRQDSSQNFSIPNQNSRQVFKHIQEPTVRPGLIFRKIKYNSWRQKDHSLGPQVNKSLILSHSQNQESIGTQPIENCPCNDRPKVLIVDDNIFNVYAVQTMIENILNSPKCDSALNGLIAYEAVQKREQERRNNPCVCGKETQNYSLILMDCNMPVMDGFCATIKIRDYLTNQSTQPLIVALTAYNTKRFEEKCFQAGMDKFLSKPVELGEIEALLMDLKLIIQ
ncbi:hypothetical protein FGO68_gene5675 [Halteria grandinella]|uniref:Histidine kinase n=1 Tax=Halteria grandinella TaxID=5974 RepID=A0A8J8P286_HALGN|nr:hypothetical protein FGO68_gene5675 [Halteria grandinella]